MAAGLGSESSHESRFIPVRKSSSGEPLLKIPRRPVNRNDVIWHLCQEFQDGGPVVHLLLYEDAISETTNSLPIQQLNDFFYHRHVI
jgi:hypothetical protein